MRPQPLICVTDVEASSRWYQRLLGCHSGHGGKQYEQLVKDGRLILQLHSFEVEHHHGAIGNRADRPYGNGVLLWFEVDDFDALMERAGEMGVEMVRPRHRNPPDGEAAPTTGSVGCATRTDIPWWSRVLTEPLTVPGGLGLSYSRKNLHRRQNQRQRQDQCELRPERHGTKRPLHNSKINPTQGCRATDGR